MLRGLLTLLPFVSACEVGNVHSNDPTVAWLSIAGSVIVSCFVAWMVFRK